MTLKYNSYRGKQQKEILKWKEEKFSIQKTYSYAAVCCIGIRKIYTFTININIEIMTINKVSEQIHLLTVNEVAYDF